MGRKSLNLNMQIINLSLTKNITNLGKLKNGMSSFYKAHHVEGPKKKMKTHKFSFNKKTLFELNYFFVIELIILNK